MQKMKTTTAGLEDVVAGETAICTVGKEEAGLTYRGYSIQALAENSTFEEVAYLLIHGKLPDQKTLDHYYSTLKQNQKLPSIICDLLEHLPITSHPMDILRTACSALGNIEPETKTNTAEQIADRLMPFCVSALLYWYQFHQNNKPSQTTEEPTLAGQFLYQLYGMKPDQDLKQALDASLILYAEHEFNASTFAARVCASTGSDFYSCIVAAIGTLRGPLHGGANEAAMELISQFKSETEAAKGLQEMLVNKKLIMGFGHRVYKHSDPRTPIIKDWAKKLANRTKESSLLPVAETIEKIMWQEKKLFPNLDFYSALVYHYLSIPTFLFTPLFVVSRISGWSAHIIEQRAHNRLIRPLADYVGPDLRSYRPIKER